MFNMFAQLGTRNILGSIVDLPIHDCTEAEFFNNSPVEIILRLFKLETVFFLQVHILLQRAYQK